MTASQIDSGPTSAETLAEATPLLRDAASVVERFVVGIDGSEQSIEGLRWAARIASDTGADIDVLTTWEPQLRMPGPFTAPFGSTDTGPEDDAQAMLTRVVDAVYGPSHPANVTMRAWEGEAAHVLIEQSATADLLVIGSRGLGEVAGLVLGSVSARCAEQAHCPVLIMHAPSKR